jgi:hypothetical protein
MLLQEGEIKMFLFFELTEDGKHWKLCDLKTPLWLLPEYYEGLEDNKKEK